MTIKEYLHTKYSSFGVTGFDGELEAVMASGAFSDDTELTKANMRSVEVAFVKRVPELLLLPTSISELGVSVSRAGTDALRLYYSAKCHELGLENLLEKEKKPRVTIY